MQFKRTLRLGKQFEMGTGKKKLVSENCKLLNRENDLQESVDEAEFT